MDAEKALNRIHFVFIALYSCYPWLNLPDLPLVHKRAIGRGETLIDAEKALNRTYFVFIALYSCLFVLSVVKSPDPPHVHKRAIGRGETPIDAEKNQKICLLSAFFRLVRVPFHPMGEKSDWTRIPARRLS